MAVFDNTHSITDILKQADNACYAAKEKAETESIFIIMMMNIFLSGKVRCLGFHVSKEP